jgi:hypothetical protein
MNGKKVMYSGADWLKRDAKKEVSEFGEQVADLLGFAFGGIYHIERTVLKADFSDSRFISVTVGQNDMSTFDSNTLTELVFLAHWMCMRFQITGAAPGCIRLQFSKRNPLVDKGDFIYSGHPSLDEAVASFKEYCDIPEVLHLEVKNDHSD